eukprot:CAMPEP_0113671036 /NCGR_PEP_ID=MMETSP0038_2-20120614/5482_1 /TAXON_ID=2898 /ORGANISM="Cryptomonas paramecium" /LENGTH=132 /DNA_ID=CAMNT_0000587145 /DNA_START=348 /DNA_END=746 /DNA_ORIENTATION=+ /assembly_acc=CAM_ASM_000170
MNKQGEYSFGSGSEEFEDGLSPNVKKLSLHKGLHAQAKDSYGEDLMNEWLRSAPNTYRGTATSNETVSRQYPATARRAEPPAGNASSTHPFPSATGGVGLSRRVAARRSNTRPFTAAAAPGRSIDGSAQADI